MTSRLRMLARGCRDFVGRCAIVVMALPGASMASGACLTLAGYPDGTELTRIALPKEGSPFEITYVHSVTLAPVRERFRVDGSDIVEMEIAFDEHGPGLPTEADAKGTFVYRDAQFIATMDRRFPSIVMRVHSDQAPRLATETHAQDLAQWGNRALRLAAIPGRCGGS